LSDFLNCPKAYYHKRILKDVVDPPNDAGLVGDYIHKAFEVYLKERTPLPTTFPDNIRDWPTGLKPPAAYQSYLDAILNGSGELHVENRYAITKDLVPCDFFAPDVWCRAILDVIHIDGQVARVIDHKSGKRKQDTRQLKLSALMVFAHHPEVQIVKTAYMWLKEGVRDDATYVRAGEAELWLEFIEDLQRYKTAAKTMTFGPRPSGLCNGWCPVTKCEFWKPKRR
jgi:hypothetical protein